MCGIAGILNFDGAPVRSDLLQQMTDRIAHRGPDGEGFYIEGPVGLGHRRLAIIDLSTYGRQPLSNEDDSIWITFNGEIYNFAVIRQELIDRGHHFRSSTDTEIIVHAYEEWGFECLQRFNGMFAFALWDQNKSRLWLVRDRLGVKPLFYSVSSARLLFASESKSILCDPSTARDVNHSALPYFLSLNYMPAPYTLFRDIEQLLPGQYLIIEKNGHIEKKIYWDLIYQEQPEDKREAEYIEEFAHLLEDSVRQRLVSDVPFGSFLSGGVDSSSIAYWMSKNMPDPVKTFSIGFNESNFNELVYSRQVAESIHSDHHEEVIQPQAAEILSTLVWHSEEPTADSSMLAVYFLAEMTQKHVKMALSGDGADEILAGYSTYSAYYILKMYQILPTWFRRQFVNPLTRFLPVTYGKVDQNEKIRRFINGSDYSPEDAHANWRIIFNKDERWNILSDEMRQYAAQSDVIDLYRGVFAQTNAQHSLNRMLYVDTRFYLPNDMLVKVDRMTMAHGLEVRVPFLDYRLVEYAASVPSSLKLRHLFITKYLLKQAMKGRLPEVVLRRKKEGFNVPNAPWMRGDLKPFVLDTLSARRVKEMGLLNANAVEKMLFEHFSGQGDHSHQIWGILSLMLWWNQFVR